MESPKRRALKSRDYRRHRMMRLLNRRKATAQEAMSEIAERELMRRLRITPLKKFEGGKNTEQLSDDEYYNIMERVAEENNPKWNESRLANGEEPLSPDEEYVRILNDNTYNYREYYNTNPRSRTNADTHWPDTFKTVYHPTFSNESVYSGKRSQYNPNGLIGGYWIGETFHPKQWQVVRKYEGGKNLFDQLDEYAEQAEPYAAGLALGSDAIALGTAATGIGAPVGAAIATAGNIPNLAIDAYQAARNWHKYRLGDNDDLTTPIISTGEAVLDAAGISSALKGISYLKDRAIANEVARIYEREFAARNGKRFLLRKKGMSDGEIAKYIAQKAANATLNSKELAQTKKKETGKQNRRNAVAKPVVRATSNVATNFVAPQYFDAQNNYKPVWQRN